MAIDILNE